MQPISLLEYALKNTRQKIIDGEYREGCKLTPKAVADELGISQTPVKEAFNRLVSERLLEAVPRRGYQVASFSTEYLRNIMDARILIESYIAEKSVLSVDSHPEIMQQLRRSLEEMHVNSGAYLENPMAWESSFHLKIAELANNDFLLEAYRQLWNVMVVYYIRKLPTWPQTDPYNSPAEHWKMYQYLNEKNADALKEVFIMHVARMEEKLGISAVSSQLPQETDVS